MKKLFILLSSFALLFCVLTSPVQAATVSSAPTQKQIDETAQVLKFINEEASTKDSKGNIISVDVDKIAAKYGNSKELMLLKQEIKNDKNISMQRSFSGTKFRSCVTSAVADQFGVSIIQQLMNGGFTSLLAKKAYQQASKLLLKYVIAAGIGSNAVAVGAFVAYYGGKCAAYANS